MRQHLFIDADDTLWENNIYFEHATEAFIEFLDHSSLSPHEIRAVINEVELTQGYGTASFIHRLQKAYRRLCERDVTTEALERIKTFGEQIQRHPMQLIDGVKETLEYLAPRHMLAVLTKGDQDEQRLKLDNSGLADYFEHIIVVAEKNVETYKDLIQKFALLPERSWMIGNSPRSDINPALAAGFNAVFIPHPHTWDMEIQDVRHEGNGHLLTLHAFSELRQHF
ncbi:HAD family hydrolase [Ktedonosporobacter rubrisoli]|uniref:HAD family hydrolase n=1 Tax=Ktedonosporobacter rubrisoli TaxID=2509675 RepID=A0A4V0Z097_KTERU|nr:HAD family hydrolase [Ktedonosporobacter rubrisoli]QBD82461.1 HAD family hydrolase [Ktedonosporobacter rubrisoli]